LAYSGSISKVKQGGDEQTTLAVQMSPGHGERSFRCGEGDQATAPAIGWLRQ
jgi:hypothetical protein